MHTVEAPFAEEVSPTFGALHICEVILALNTVDDKKSPSLSNMGQALLQNACLDHKVSFSEQLGCKLQMQSGLHRVFAPGWDLDAKPIFDELEESRRLLH